MRMNEIPEPRATPAWRRRMEELARAQDEMEARRPGSAHAVLARMIRTAIVRSEPQLRLPMEDGDE